MSRTHIHENDAPKALDLLFQWAPGRAGFERTPTGAFVDWDELIPGTLSTSETAVAYITRGVAILEAHGGGVPARMRRAVNDAIEAVA